MLKKLFHRFADAATRQLREENREIRERLIHIEDKENELIERAIHIEDKENELIERAIHIEDKENELRERAIHIEDKENELIERAIHIEDKENEFRQDVHIDRENAEVFARSLSRQITNVEKLLPETRRVHFIRCIDIYNIGDISCSPLDYFPEFQKCFNCYVHTLKNINYSLINSDDFVIIGGGGLFECNENYQNSIIRLLSMPVKVIAWGVGHNLHSEGSPFYNDAINEIDYGKFFVLTTRDYEFKGQRFMPCVSCMMKGLDRNLPIKRRIGIVEHHDIPINEFDFEKCSNSDSIEKVLDFIASSEIIISNTYHCSYWATLMKRKVIIYKPFSSKFLFFKYKPVIYSGDLEADIAKSKVYPLALEEFRRMNVSFAEEIIRTILNEPVQ